MTPVEAAGVSDIGRSRARNEDALHLVAELGIAIVSDGMGGAPAGARASAIAVERAAEALTRAAMDDWREAGVAAESMLQAVSEAHGGILQDQVDHPDRFGMGATLTALLLDPRDGYFVIGHVGDSRAYRRTASGLEQLTKDQTLIQEQVDQGRISPELAKHHPLGHILSNVLGMAGGPDPQLIESELAPGEELLLCTDGVMAVLDDRELADMLARGSEWTAEAVVGALVDAANARGGPDNSTAILLRLR